MRKPILIAALVLAGLVGYALYLARAAGEFRSVTDLRPGVCAPVAGAPGAEDITFDPTSGLAWISSDDRRARIRGESGTGAIMLYDPLTQQRPRDAWPGAPEDFHPHGISLFVGADGQRTLMAVNHPGESLFGDSGQPGPAHSIEIFDVAGQRLVHRRTLTDPSLVSPNDLVAVDHQRFYVTNDHGSPPGWKRKLEDYLRLPRASVVHYDGQRFRTAADGLTYANGINLSPDGATLYVAEVTRNRIRQFARNRQTGALAETRRISVGFGVDNIEIDRRTGDLWLGGHMKLLTFVRHAAEAAVKSPSMAARLRIAGDDVELTPAFIDDGEVLSGASVAVADQGVLLIGSVFEAHFIQCEPGAR